LQPLDVSIFAPLATAYKAGVRERSKYIINYSIDKVDFLEIMGTARDQAITPINVQKAWQAVRLEPYDPSLVMNQLPKRPLARPITPPSTVTWTGPTGEAIQVPITLANVAQVDELFQRIIKGKHQLDPALVLQIQKLRKGASKAIADSVIQRTTNVELITAEMTKKKQSNRQKGKNYGFRRVLNAKTLREREGFCLLQEYWAYLSRCQPNLLGPVKKGKRALSQAKKACIQAVLQPTPSVLELLSPEKLIDLDWATGLAIDLTSPAKGVSKALGKAKPIQTVAMPKTAAIPRKAPVPKKVPVRKMVVDLVNEHAQDVVQAV